MLSNTRFSATVTEPIALSADAAHNSDLPNLASIMQNKRALRNSVCALMIFILPVATAIPTLAAGPNTSAPLPPPPTPTPVTPSNTQTAIAADATCSQQLTNAILNTSIASTALSGAAVGAAAAAAVLPPPADAVGELAAAVLDIGATASNTAQNVYQAAANGLPSCDQAFTGTVSVAAGGVNVTGNSVFQNNVGVAGDLTAAGSLNASQLHTSQGLLPWAVGSRSATLMA